MTPTISMAAALLVLGSVSLSSLRGKFQDAGVPRDAKGMVRMDAPPPRTPDGKPDLSGNWLRADREPLPSELAGLFSQRDRVNAGGDVVAEPQVPTFPADPNSPPVGAFWDIATNVSGGLPLTPWAAGVKKERMASDMKDNPDANCMPMGITQFHMQPQPLEGRADAETDRDSGPSSTTACATSTRTDGRFRRRASRSRWDGYSVGRWEGDTLVVETNNLRGAEESPVDGWLDVRGTP